TSSRRTSSRRGSSTSGRTRSTRSGCARTRTSSRSTSTSEPRLELPPGRTATSGPAGFVVSRSLGAQLPDALPGRLMAADPAARPGEAIVLVTVDPYGRPHPALLSYAELLALDPTRIRLGLHAGTRSVTHLADSGRATLVFADAQLNLYVKADAV